MAVTSVHIQLAEELQALQAAMCNLGLWNSEPPSAAALASVEPFACDTMVFTQWLQYIFIPRLHSLVEQGARLPEKCDVSPMGEEHFKATSLCVSPLLASLHRIDTLISRSSNALPN